MPRCPTCKRPLRAPSSASTPAERSSQSTSPSPSAPNAASGPDDPARFAPFCSQRCKLADLHGWLSGSYVISEALPFDESEGLLPTADPQNEDT